MPSWLFLKISCAVPASRPRPRCVAGSVRCFLFLVVGRRLVGLFGLGILVPHQLDSRTRPRACTPQDGDFIALTSPTSAVQIRLDQPPLSFFLGCILMWSEIATAQTVNALMTIPAGSAPSACPSRTRTPRSPWATTARQRRQSGLRPQVDGFMWTASVSGSDPDSAFCATSVIRSRHPIPSTSSTKNIKRSVSQCWSAATENTPSHLSIVAVGLLALYFARS